MVMTEEIMYIIENENAMRSTALKKKLVMVRFRGQFGVVLEPTVAQSLSLGLDRVNRH